MTKILLVEDDKSLREIYGVRLLAEGYDIVSASDGEEAIVAAKKELPDLIVSDVMMPRVSGFDMLDILKSSPETKDIKVIIMTALSSDDQRARGEALGADLFLVKSQVGIEDVVRAVKEVLEGKEPSVEENNLFSQSTEEAELDITPTETESPEETLPEATPEPEAPLEKPETDSEDAKPETEPEEMTTEDKLADIESRDAAIDGNPGAIRGRQQINPIDDRAEIEKTELDERYQSSRDRNVVQPPDRS